MPNDISRKNERVKTGRGEIIITLKSDLCVGSGYSYAGIIDSDVCCGENGIPYIPARRLKGCLREAAELIGLENTDEIFGTPGSDKSCAVSLSNAYPVGSEELNEELARLKDSAYSDVIDARKVLGRFSYIRAQTAVDAETGSAQENSLRFTRTVRQNAPAFLRKTDGEELSFAAEVEYSGFEKELERAVKALRHIGMNRSRGLGNVKCSFRPIDYAAETAVPLTADVPKDPEAEACLEYVIKNTDPLMLSGSNDAETEYFISGRRIAGMLAERCGADEELFEELFLNGSVKYTDACTAERIGGTEEYRNYVPAPFFINKLKKSGRIVNLTGSEDNVTFGVGDDLSTLGGNQPKKLKNSFVSISGDKISVRTPAVEMVYHYRNGNGGADERLLYTLKTIRRGQYFSGRIIGKQKYLDAILGLMEDEVFRLGKSRSAQYGTCRIVKKVLSGYSPTLSLKKGERIIAAFDSPAVFIDRESAAYTVRSAEVKRLTAEALGIKYEENNDSMYLQAETVMGYNMAMNLKKPAVPAVSSGSAIVYTLSEDAVINTEFAGEKNAEGFGRVSVYRCADLPRAFEEETVTARMQEPVHCRALIEEILLADFSDAVIEEAMSDARLKISPSLIGRVTLMLKESMNGREPAAAFEDFKERVDSIKRSSEKRETADFLAKSICKDVTFSIVEDADVKGMQLDIKKLSGKEGSEARRLYERLCGLIGEDAVNEKIKAGWGRQLESILTLQKYAKKGEKVNGRGK